MEEKPKQPQEINDAADVESTDPWYHEYVQALKNVIDLRDGLDRYGTITSIRKNIHLKGDNVWLLICSIMVASIGLDQSSVAVIIGGMLISPLMYPILGLGLSIAMNDRVNLVLSFKNFSIAVLVALVTSTLYFAITPFGMENAEILARTQPDLRDVFVGFFGGIAGIVAGSRKDVSSAIPGVAIATALLPPICVAGYGLSNLNMTIFGGAFYLFLMNTFFIMIATYLVVRYLKFPYKQHASEAQRKRARTYILLAAFIMVIPSVFFLLNSIKRVTELNHVKSFVADNFENNDHINVINWSFDKRDTINVIEITCQIDDKLSGSELDSIKNLLINNYKVNNAILNLTQIEVSEDDINDMKNEQSAFKSDIEKALDNFKAVIGEKDSEIRELEQNLQTAGQDSVVFAKIRDVLKVWYPDIESIAVGDLWYSDYEEEGKQLMVLIDWKKTYYKSVLQERTKKITEYTLMEYPFLDTIYIQYK